MMARAQRTISDVVREIMVALPEVEEFESHGAPTFRVRGKVFATYMINHHGDGRVALWLVAPRGAQAAFVESRGLRIESLGSGKKSTGGTQTQKKRSGTSGQASSGNRSVTEGSGTSAYFVPPYVGARGWLGVELDKGLGWGTVQAHVRDAYEMVSPAELARAIGKDLRVRPPTRKFRPEEIDPFQGKVARAVLGKLAVICGQLPETEPGTKFGSPIWKVGKKTFVSSHLYTGRLKLSFWVGAARQAKLAKDKRFRVSLYTGHSGWIDLDVEERPDWDEIEQLVLESYRHFALKRMLKELGVG
jgi:predicted DNA-binding protein (MmcQ/YjbR family)